MHSYCLDRIIFIIPPKFTWREPQSPCGAPKCQSQRMFPTVIPMLPGKDYYSLRKDFQRHLFVLSCSMGESKNGKLLKFSINSKNFINGFKK